MSDLVKRLRAAKHFPMNAEAADRIERLEGYIRYALDGPAHVATIRKILTDALQDDKP